MTLVPGNDKKGTSDMKNKGKRTGVVNCLRLHILAEPKLGAEVVCKIRYLTQVEIDLANSTEDFYKICTEIGAEGFCQKEYLSIK